MKRLIFLASYFIFSIVVYSQPVAGYKPDKGLLKIIQRNFTDAGAQYKVLAQHVPADQFPQTFYPETGKYEFSTSRWWCSGFYPGTLLYLYEQTKDTALYTEAQRILKTLEKEKNNTSTHDLGFMMGCSFGNADKISPREENKQILLASARSLATRFNPAVGCIKSWDSKDGDFLVIIDNMMNLELLFKATSISGDSSFYKIAVTHANTTMQNHFRSDNSSYHVLNYNPVTGAVQQRRTAQGAADESAWARGQAWGLYGYTVTYRETKDKQYLDQANKIARFLLHHPRLPANKIPYWDFDAPGIPDVLRDASAAAIMASALIELSHYVGENAAKEYLDASAIILRTLSNSTYKAAPGTNGGFILKHSVGHMPNKTEVDVPLTYSDYYFIEAMTRYQLLK